MNIREIAKLADVSISTVSKIINGKDKNISVTTRERVLKVIKENNYVPYKTFIDSKKNLIIGVIIKDKENDILLNSILDTASQYGYQCFFKRCDNKESEEKAIDVFMKYNISGIVICNIFNSLDDKTDLSLLEKNNIPYSIITGNNKENNCIDFSMIGYNLTNELISKRHDKIACVVKNDGIKSKHFLLGYKKCLYENRINLDANLSRTYLSKNDIDEVFIKSISAIVCYDYEIAKRVYEVANRMNLRIPQDLSVVSAVNYKNEMGLIPQLSYIEIPYYELGQNVIKNLVNKIENKAISEIEFKNEYKIINSTSIDIPNSSRNKKIVVVGAMNIDTLVDLGCYPKEGETVVAKNRVVTPGGKGVNQAVGASKLGLDVNMIGKIGKDYDGSVLYDFLIANNVNVQGVQTDDKLSTGHAYIYIENMGESGIVIYNGANNNLTPTDIYNNKYLFKDTSFCLLQTEINMDTVECSAKLAKKNNTKVILKPAAVSDIPTSLLKDIDIIVPNINEAKSLLPDIKTLEGKADYFLENGVKDVIITLGSDGCFWKNNKKSQYFKAADFNPIDTTGAADAFISALASYLTKNYSMEESIRYATYAAGFCITRKGVPNSLVDQSTLELYLMDI